MTLNQLPLPFRVSPELVERGLPSRTTASRRWRSQAPGLLRPLDPWQPEKGVGAPGVQPLGGRTGERVHTGGCGEGSQLDSAQEKWDQGRKPRRLPVFLTRAKKNLAGYARAWRPGTSRCTSPAPVLVGGGRKETPGSWSSSSGPCGSRGRCCSRGRSHRASSVGCWITMKLLDSG